MECIIQISPVNIWAVCYHRYNADDDDDVLFRIFTEFPTIGITITVILPVFIDSYTFFYLNFPKRYQQMGTQSTNKEIEFAEYKT